MSTVETPEREVRAVAKWVRTSPRKARLVADHIRGRSVPEARTILAFTPRAAAREVEKVLRSAVANAEANHGMVGDRLVISAAYVDEGPIIKRYRARARGRIGRIRKPTCHITVKVRQFDGAVATPPPAAPVADETTPASTTEEAAPKPARKKSEPKPETSSEAKPKRRTTRKKKEE